MGAAWAHFGAKDEQDRTRVRDVEAMAGQGRPRAIPGQTDRARAGQDYSRAALLRPGKEWPKQDQQSRDRSKPGKRRTGSGL